ncbi:M6 family metalloprotease domain-containing protein [Clostridium sp. SHJSY1]|uniref:M6 family metalloprotease domain-containing protein n=1 Tax=Clostridium sp. SHJSY1 TaxID=2942483 RepID=UPI002874D74D|nr:M6 family metalloprotease domain-containing protein [Clostridium sp. SHJSY1]MDS0524490.1 M6 family metalloprotease domain-containing protein [Clostridium sp. SHJSY1]
MNKFKKRLVLFTIASSLYLGANIQAEAAPVFDKLTTLKQPDNTPVQVKITGDEYYQQIESTDGFTLCRNSDGWICYAELNADKSDFVATKEIYKDNTSERSLKEKHISIDKKSEDKKRDKVKKEIDSNKTDTSSNPKPSAAFASSALLSPSKATTNETTNTLTAPTASTENIKGLTILIKFPDEQSAISKNEINNFLNQSGYKGFSNNGSVKDYFSDVSGGKVNYTNTVTEFYTAKHPKSYYDGSNITDYHTSPELINEALNWLKSTNFDFSTLTKDSNNMAKAVNVLYAGTPDSGWSKGLWPHQGYLPKSFESNGIKIQKYELTNIGNDLSLGTICHENGHLLFGYPDLYDYNYKSNGCGTYSLMSFISNEKNPVPPDPYCRNVISGWNTPQNLNSVNNGTQVSLPSSSSGNQTSYKWTGSNPKEYFLIENIKKEGRYSTAPDEGLMIWHIDENGNNSNYSMTSTSHYKVSVVQADNKLQLEKKENYGNGGDLFRAGGNSKFNSASSPSSKWWNQTSSGLDISNVSNVGNNMTFVKSGTTATNTNTTSTESSSNLAAKAKVASSYCSNWESTTALNDGFTPTNSNDRSHAVYGNWPRTNAQWIQYTFDKDYTISKSDIYWFKDNGGIDVPSSYKIKYWNGSAWADVTKASGLGIKANAFNTTTFTPITTRSIVIEINPNNSKSTGVLEWRVY